MNRPKESRGVGSTGLWVILPAVAAGAVLGLGAFTFAYARGASYLTDDPEACVNCHVMREQHTGWMSSSHRRAVCNDCHTPPGLIAKYATKALNGVMHSWAFTTGRFPDRIRMRARNRRAVESSCLHCHADVAAGIRAVRRHPGETGCVDCHAAAGHP